MGVGIAKARVKKTVGFGNLGSFRGVFDELWAFLWWGGYVAHNFTGRESELMSIFLVFGCDASFLCRNGKFRN